MRSKDIFIRYFAFAIIGLTWGMIAARFDLPPYSIANSMYDTLRHNYDRLEVEKPLPEHQLTDVDAIISISDAAEVRQLRAQVIELLFNGSGLPTTQPSVVNKGISAHPFSQLDSLARLDEILVTMEFGLESRAYHMLPKTPNEKLVLYHQGHLGGFELGTKTIEPLLDAGYAVLAFSMPLVGLNNQPTVDLPRFGVLKITDHSQFKFLSPEAGHPIRYFIEPVVVGLNHMQSEYEYNSVAMVGISGGGWTTTLSAAIDTRISKSFPVAGSYPIFLRSNEDWGHYELTDPELYRTANYLELYMLGSVGSGRKQLQIINQFDSCCYSGTHWTLYRDDLRDRVNGMGQGEFDVFADSSHSEHMISKVALNRILSELEQVIE